MQENKLFRTVIKTENYPITIDYNTKSMFLGSCFTENIGLKIKDLKFKTDINPFGIIYNPISIKNSLDMLLIDETFTDKDLFFHNEQWNSLFHHSRFSGTDKNGSSD